MVAILVIATLVIFAVVELFLRLSGARPQRRSDPVPFDPVPLPGHFLHAGHTWAEVRRSGQVRIGADEFVRTASSMIDGVVLPNEGQQVRQGEPLLELMSGPNRMVLSSPLSGRVEISNQDALSGGVLGAHRWICALRPSNLSDELGQLRVAEGASMWMRAERDRLVDWIAGRAVPGMAATLPDGGMPVRGFLDALEPPVRTQFELCFLQHHAVNDAQPETAADPLQEAQ